MADAVQDTTVADYDDSTGRKGDLLAAFDAVEAKTATPAAAVKVEQAIPATDPEPKPEPEEKTGTEKPEKTEGEESEKPVETKSELEPPKNWTQARKEQFKELPEPAKQILLDRFKEMDADYTRKTSEIAEQRKLYGAVDEVFAPYRDQMRAAGYTPEIAVKAWAQAEIALSNPETRDQAFKELATAYKFDLSKLVDAPRQPAAIDPNDAEAVAKAELDKILTPYLSPSQKEIEALKATVAQLTATQTRTQDHERNSAANRVMSEITTFIEAKDATGNSLHPYFADVENGMAIIAAGLQRMNQPVPPLEELYQRAVWENPVTRDRMLSAQRTAEETKVKEAARAKSAQAKRAGSSVTGAAGTAQPRANGQAHDVSIRDLVSRAYDDVTAH